MSSLADSLRSLIRKIERNRTKEETYTNPKNFTWRRSDNGKSVKNRGKGQDEHDEDEDDEDDEDENERETENQKKC